MNSIDVMTRYGVHLAAGGADIETPQGMVDIINARPGPFVASLKSGRAGMSVVEFDQARARIDARRAKRQDRSAGLQSDSTL